MEDMDSGHPINPFIRVTDQMAKACGNLKRVIVTPAVYPRLFEFHHFDIQRTGQKSHCVNTI